MPVMWQLQKRLFACGVESVVFWFLVTDKLATHIVSLAGF